MTRVEFRKAFELAGTETDLSKFDLSQFDGFGLPGFQPVTVTLGQVARLLRWQALRFDGSWDMEAAHEVLECGRRRFVVVG